MLMDFRAVAGRDVVFRRVLVRRLFDERAQQLAVGLNPWGLDDPFLAVPLLELYGTGALVVGAGNVDCGKQSGRTQLGDALVVEIEVLEAPLHLLAAQRAVAEM